MPLHKKRVSTNWKHSLFANVKMEKANRKTKEKVEGMKRALKVDVRRVAYSSGLLSCNHTISLLEATLADNTRYAALNLVSCFRSS